MELARERMRVDRNGSPLALLIIDLPAKHTTKHDFEFLAKVLAGRLRITDTAGFLPQRRVGVLLPDTPPSGAWKVASDVCEVYPVGDERPSCQVITYPDDADLRRDVDAERNGQHVADGGRAWLEGLLIHPTAVWKRAVDVIGASIGLLLTSPLLLAIGAAIKLTSAGPAIYSQEREGRGGRRFRIYKLRTMRLDADQMQSQLRQYSEQDGPAFKMTRDPRTTWIGRLLRISSLDELPQLWNVLRGEMSLVGPRPLPMDESRECEPWQRQRLAVLPGITCAWQVWGRNTVSFDEWMRMDLQYVRRQSLAYDVQLLLKTPPSLLLQRGPR
jgi:lipopolysaccharide/colanic/teichoic acid biosynthesis glycosyltransferase